MKKIKTKSTNRNEIPSLKSLEDLQTSETSDKRCYTEWAILIVKILIYLTGQAIACKLEFGAVFFCCAALCAIWLSLDDRKRKRDELSAYSVFNPNFEAIDGTVTADQLRKQMTFGAL